MHYFRCERWRESCCAFKDLILGRVFCAFRYVFFKLYNLTSWGWWWQRKKQFDWFCAKHFPDDVLKSAKYVIFFQHCHERSPVLWGISSKAFLILPAKLSFALEEPEDSLDSTILFFPPEADSRGVRLMMFFVMLIHLVDSGQGIDSLIHISQVSGSDSSDFCLITNLRFSDQWGVSIPSDTSACLGKIYSGFLAEKLYTVSSLSWVRGLPINGLLFAQKAAVFSH